ncbi:amidohydrolase family protein [Actinocrispum wychmicini]|uniref:Putative TIM-barrel fold metal-dependent hydrolase n=1 Tax=Actinocrispum wychmicini TaxID=1213861 RepID=A0A4R2J737_9PSEU|nr:amidohydrolase family protein [Actinocrispum wychmicini]TCO54324.1 putative TIM-barrel fold metal-dependent hydrolase [Actinocrispum wychmicini]
MPHIPLLSQFRPRSTLRAPEHHVLRARFPAVDAHAHLGRWLASWVGDGREWTVRHVPTLLATMEAHNIRAMVNLDGRWGDELEVNLDRYDRAHPGRFATFCHVDWQDVDSPEALVGSLAASAAAGAAGLKVWKDLGLEVRDSGGRLVLLDDQRLDPLWTAAGELNLPVWVHSADPVAFFDPVDERNEKLDALIGRPDWSFADPSFPAFRTLIDSLESVVAAHPGTCFVGVHGGCYPENLGWVSRMLDTYANFHVDIAARISELGRQPRAARTLILRHPGRVLFGVDEIPVAGREYPYYFRFLETADEHFPYSPDDPPPLGRWAIHGLDLPDGVLRQVYSDNAARLVPRLAS